MRKCCSPAASSATASARPTSRCRAFTAAAASRRSKRRSARFPAWKGRGSISRPSGSQSAGRRTSRPPVHRDAQHHRLTTHIFTTRRADEDDETLTELIRALAVAGFAASNIMLLSVSIWSGADASIRNVFHWISALIAFPALVYSGRVFFSSAWRALRHGQTNMDVPISIGVLLAFGMSLYETFHHEAARLFRRCNLTVVLPADRPHARSHDARARTNCCQGLGPAGLARRARGAGRRHARLSAGERDPAGHAHPAGGGRARAGRCPRRNRRSEIDCSLVSGESLPQPVAPGAVLSAGTLNLTGPLTIVATAAAEKFIPRRNGTDDGSGRSRALGLPAHRGSRLASLCAGRPSHRAPDFHRLDDRGTATCIAR